MRDGFELEGAAAWPTRGGEPVFAAPWEGRAFGLAFDVVRRSGLEWSSFRDRLIAALAEDPQRAYFESWVVALERLVVECVDVDVDDLRSTRADVAAYHYVEDGHPIEVTPVATDAGTIERVAAVLAGRVGEGGGFVSGAHVELRRSSHAQGIRSFDAAGQPVADVDLTQECWDDLVHALLPEGPRRRRSSNPV